MNAYPLLQFQLDGLKDGWKIFRRDSGIQVYWDEETAKECCEKYKTGLGDSIKVKSKRIHPRIRHPKYKWQDKK
ncbi:MAG: hypothetical protein ABIB47_03635 [Candidatus Woesearchaeota archaeon]